MKHLVYVVSYVRNVDDCELPLAVLHSQRSVASWLGIPLRNLQRQFECGCSIAVVGKYQIEKVYIE